MLFAGKRKQGGEEQECEYTVTPAHASPLLPGRLVQTKNRVRVTVQ